MGRRPCCSKEEGLNRGAWTAMEDKILIDYITAHGEGKWRSIPKAAGLKRCGKSCRLRWLNYLRPDIKRGNISRDEEDLIIRLHKLLGNRWSLIAGRIPGRTDNEIKNYWNSVLSKRQQRPAQLVKKSDYTNIEDDGKKQRIIVKEAPTSSSKVIHAEARRCTTVFIAPQIHQTIIGDQNDDNNDDNNNNNNNNIDLTVPSFDIGHANKLADNETAPVQSESSDGEIKCTSSKFAMDLGIGDISNFSEAFASDDIAHQINGTGFDFCDFGHWNGMLENWSSTGSINDQSYVEFEANNLDSDFGFLSAYLDQSSTSSV